ncbi:MAG: metal ABC transporter ATP-binding protein [Actinobacteria bacterium]|nr:metal ABC transporter ATP-binding protein [Actinomycetota bacterium]
MNRKVLVKLDNVGVSFGKTAVLEGIDLEIHEREVVALIGLNGAGKTTLLKAILGIYKPSTGSVKVNARRIGYVPQRLNFDRSIPITVGELLQAYGGEAATIKSKLTLTGGSHLVRKRVGDLSSGELQRVLLANALLSNPELLLLDEPMTGVDVIGERSFLEVIKRLQDEQDVAIILVSHDIHLVYRYADRVLCINKTMLCQGPPNAIIDDSGFLELFGDYLIPYEHEHN